MRLSLDCLTTGGEVRGGDYIELPEGQYRGQLVRVAHVLPRLEAPADTVVMLNVDHLDRKVGRMAVSLTDQQSVFKYGQAATFPFPAVEDVDDDWLSELEQPSDEDED